MIRLLISFVIQLAANAVGLIVASWVIDDVTISGPAFLVAVLIFTVVYALAQPFLTQLALSKASALRGGVALVATLVGLLITSWVSDGLSIDSGLAWIEATVIVWVVSLLGVLILPAIFVKKKVPGEPLLTGSTLVEAVRASLATGGDPERAAGQQKYMKSELPFRGFTMRCAARSAASRCWRRARRVDRY